MKPPINWKPLKTKDGKRVNFFWRALTYNFLFFEQKKPMSIGQYIQLYNPKLKNEDYLKIATKLFDQ